MSRYITNYQLKRIADQLEGKESDSPHLAIFGLIMYLKRIFIIFMIIFLAVKLLGVLKYYGVIDFIAALINY